MSRQNAQAVSTMLVGGLGAALLFSQGIHLWAALIAWAVFDAAGGDVGALKKTIAGAGLGILVGWAAEVAVFSIPVDPGSWYWIPRSAGAVAIGLLLLTLASRVELFSHLPSLLAGFATVFAAVLIPSQLETQLADLTSVGLANPLFNLVIAMTAGAVLGLAANRLAATIGGGEG